MNSKDSFAFAFDQTINQDEVLKSVIEASYAPASAYAFNRHSTNSRTFMEKKLNV